MRKMREKKEINIQIGAAIKAARERTGLTQEQFGELVSLGTKNVSDIERGISGITIATLKRICEKLSISSDMILFGMQDKNDSEFLAERLSRLTPEQFNAVETFLNQVFVMYAKLDRDDNFEK